eukprot:EG_transcript_25408
MLDKTRIFKNTSTKPTNPSLDKSVCPRIVTHSSATVPAKLPPASAARSTHTLPGFIISTMCFSIRTGAFFPGMKAVMTMISTSRVPALQTKIQDTSPWCNHQLLQRSRTHHQPLHRLLLLPVLEGPGTVAAEGWDHGGIHGKATCGHKCHRGHTACNAQ